MKFSIPELIPAAICHQESRRFFLASIFAFFAAFECDAADSKSVNASELPKITVNAGSLKIGSDDGYKAVSTRSSTRTETPLIDVPQSISVITQEQIRDQNITNMGEAIRYVPGINIRQGENNRDEVVIRGNESNADFYIDGARDDVQYFRDFYNIEKIEVLKGPNAMAFGRGGSGGLVNRVSKFADGKRTRQVILSGGSFNNRRAQADLGDKVNEKISLRFNTMYEKSGTFRQFGDLERYGVNPTATFNLDKDTDLKIGYEHFSDTRFNDRGVPSQNGRPYKTSVSAFFGNPNFNEAETKVDSGYAIFSHKFSPDLKIRNYTRYAGYDKFYENIYAQSAVDGSGRLDISGYNKGVKRKNFTNQTDITKNFATGSIEHNLLGGIQLDKQDTETLRNTAYFNNLSDKEKVFASNPVSYTPVSFRQSGSSDENNKSQVDVYAGYLQDQIDLTKKLQLTAGFRYEIFKMKFHDKRTNSDFSQTNKMISPRAGLVFKPEENLSFYGNYSTSYLPSSGDQFASLSANTQGLKPEKLSNYEIGSKWDANPKLNLSAAIYQLDRTNSRANDPNNPGYFVLTGESRTRGFELGANGKITQKWQIIGGYSYQDAEITETTRISSGVASKGKKIALVPKNMFSVWNKYDLTDNWAGAIGVIDQSSQFAGADNSVRLKGFTRFDGAFYYRINKDYRLQINVENLLNSRYFSTAHSNNNLQPGSSRAFKAALTANF